MHVAFLCFPSPLYISNCYFMGTFWLQLFFFWRLPHFAHVLSMVFSTIIVEPYSGRLSYIHHYLPYTTTDITQSSSTHFIVSLIIHYYHSLCILWKFFIVMVTPANNKTRYTDSLSNSPIVRFEFYWKNTSLLHNTFDFVVLSLFVAYSRPGHIAKYTDLLTV